MATQGEFKLPPNTNFGVTAFANAAMVQTVNILVDNQIKTTFTGSGAEKCLGTRVINSGSGAVKVTVTVNGRPSDLTSVQVTLAKNLNFALLGSEDSTDMDYNDAIAFINWPIG